ncbi:MULTISPECIES: hypothetical protein [Paenibacillus]|uniref:Uncharacterized protein n=1 Tax=Paenibacillus xylanilyticus TaxID=248903 RepID=A0A7Y6BYI9_9BACL|nr:hypothetical protein [Paenibacillus xylanilyticus]NUU76490.1 hypothetical protein [Paenibacillus xylanilyticus]
MSDPKNQKANKELEPGVNTVLHPDSNNPGPTDMIEDAVGEIIDNITGHSKNKTATNSENKPNK